VEERFIVVLLAQKKKLKMCEDCGEDFFYTTEKITNLNENIPSPPQGKT
jgi:hypothetical protein